MFRGIAMASIILLAACAHAPSHTGASSRDGHVVEIAAWQQFVSTLRSGSIRADLIRPYRPEIGAPLRGFLERMARATSQTGRWSEWEVVPEIHRVGDHVHYLVDLTIESRARAPHAYCFTLLLAGGRWYIRHLEAIFVRLDRLGALPTSTFPDLPEGRKAWMRAENALTEQVRLFNLLAQEKGREFAFRWFRDGGGYFLSARTWVPFVEPARAFVLYAAWEQAKLRGNEVRLEQLERDKAMLTIRSNELLAYEQTSHIRQRISLADLRTLLETVWRDRAEHAGWKVSFGYRDEGVLELRFSRSP